MIRKAFTLVEILIVIVILGILAAIVIPQFAGDHGETVIEQPAATQPDDTVDMQINQMNTNTAVFSAM